MGQTVLITGTGREEALGFNLVRRYLEQGDTVFACVRKKSAALEKLAEDREGRLHILTMDISDSASVKAAAEEAGKVTDHLDLLINNAVTTAPDCGESVLKADPDITGKQERSEDREEIYGTGSFFPAETPGTGGLGKDPCLTGTRGGQLSSDL